MEISELYKKIESEWIENGEVKIGTDTAESREVRIMLKILKYYMENKNSNIPRVTNKDDYTYKTSSSAIMKLYELFSHNYFSGNDIAKVLGTPMTRNSIDKYLYYWLSKRVIRRVGPNRYAFAKVPQTLDEPEPDVKEYVGRASAHPLIPKIKEDIKAGFLGNIITTKLLKTKYGIDNAQACYIVRDLVYKNILEISYEGIPKEYKLVPTKEPIQLPTHSSIQVTPEGSNEKKDNLPQLPTQ